MSFPILLSDENKSHLEPIRDLVEYLKKHLPYQFVIAGGYPRDFLLGVEFNDIDVFLKPSSFVSPSATFSEQMEKIKKALSSTGFFDFFDRGTQNYFVEGVYYQNTSEERKIPKFRIQIISWHSNPLGAIRSFDFQHCQFMIPFMNPNGWEHLLQDGELYAYTSDALDSLKQRQLVLTSEYKEILSKDFHDLDDRIQRLERLFTRIKKFHKRGFFLNEENKISITKIVEDTLKGLEERGRKISKYYSLDNHFLHKSILLGEVSSAELYSIKSEEQNPSLYTIEAVGKRLAKELVYSLNQNPTLLLLFESQLIREAGREILEELKSK